MDIGPNGIRDICSKVLWLGGENGHFQHNRTSNTLSVNENFT
jgi:hypothetical protein